MGYVQSFLSKRNKYKRREKITLYYYVALIVTLFFTPLINVQNKTDVLSPSYQETNYTMVRYFTKEPNYEAPSELVTVGRGINQAFIPLNIVIFTIIFCLLIWNLSAQARKQFYKITGFLPYDSFLHFSGIFIICIIFLTIGTTVVLPDRISTLNVIGSGFLRITMLLVSGMLWQMYMLIHSVKERYRKQYSTPFTSEELISVTDPGDDHHVVGNSILGGGLFDKKNGEKK